MCHFVISSGWSIAGLLSALNSQVPIYTPGRRKALRKWSDTRSQHNVNQSPVQSRVRCLVTMRPPCLTFHWTYMQLNRTEWNQQGFHYVPCIRQTDKQRGWLCPPSFEHLKESFSYEVQFEKFCPNMKICCPPAGNVNRTPVNVKKFWLWLFIWCYTDYGLKGTTW